MSEDGVLAESGQWVHGNRNIQISHVAGSTIQVSINERSWHVPLEPAVAPVGRNVISPARLVKARSGVLPYVNRGGHLEALSAWIGVPDSFAVCLLGGPGGTGKTRLSVELCERTTDQAHWLSGLLPPADKTDSAGLRDLLDTPTPRLVVVDYAETRIEQLEVILPALKLAASERHPVRVLLLVRKAPQHGADWTEALRRGSDWLESVLDEATVRVLDFAILRPEARSDLFNAATLAFAGRSDRRPNPDMVKAPNLALPAYGSPLFIVIASYLAVNGPQYLPATREGLLEGLIRHEDRYWASHAVKLNISEALRRRVVALATLTGAPDITEAVAMLRLLPELSDATAERCHDLARWVHELYQATPQWWNPLEPDLLGEYLVSTELSELPAVFAGALDRSQIKSLIQPLDILTRAAAYDIHLADTINPVLSEALERLCLTAAKQVANGADLNLMIGTPTVASALERALSVISVDPAVLPAALAALPERPDVILNGLALIINEQWILELRGLTAANPAALAVSLMSFSKRLHSAGRQKESLAASEEAVGLYRRLASGNPDAFIPGLARSLTTFSNRLSNADQDVEALAASEEAVELYRGVVNSSAEIFTRNHTGTRHNLSRSLHNLANALSDMGRYKEALAAIQEAVELRRELTAANPKSFAPHLARSLTNLSNALGRMGRSDEALVAIEEAVGMHRDLVASNPTTFTTDLARSLRDLSNHLDSAGRPEDALATLEEAVHLYRGLAIVGSAAFTPDLANSLNSLSSRLDKAGRLECAIAARAEATQLYRRLAG